MLGPLRGRLVLTTFASIDPAFPRPAIKPMLIRCRCAGPLHSGVADASQEVRMCRQPRPNPAPRTPARAHSCPAPAPCSAPQLHAEAIVLCARHPPGGNQAETLPQITPKVVLRADSRPCAEKASPAELLGRRCHIAGSHFHIQTAPGPRKTICAPREKPQRVRLRAGNSLPGRIHPTDCVRPRPSLTRGLLGLSPKFRLLLELRGPAGS